MDRRFKSCLLAYWGNQVTNTMSKSNDSSTVEGPDLPAELHHESVVESANRSEPKYACFHVVLDQKDVPVMYRAQWKDDWEILFAKVDESADEPRIRLVLIERAENGRLWPYVYGLAGFVVAVGFERIGNFLVETGRMGEVPYMFGQMVVVAMLAALFVYVAYHVAADYKLANGGVRP